MTIEQFEQLPEIQQMQIIRETTLGILRDDPAAALELLINVQQGTTHVDRYTFLLAYRRIGRGLVKGVIGA